MFEKMLSESGSELNVVVGPMNPVISDFIQRNMRPNEIIQKFAAYFEQQKNLVDLIVVIIPDFPPGVYGKLLKIYLVFFLDISQP